MSDVTRILMAISQGDSLAHGALLPLVYDELRQLARAHLARERVGHTLQATALVHEAYLRLIGPEGEPSQWNGRGHFFGAAAEAMRRILIEDARSKKRIKRGGQFARVDLDEACFVADAPSDQLLALDEALRRLEEESPAKAELVQLRYFAGLTLAEAAAAQGTSLATAKRHWAYARAWLYDAMESKKKPG
ncbi:MAG TPA: ECF-type sigma factor [Lacipirellulaceae bacterium]|nr:ECF-type sigma factor [Lacipirellulaceae bacterium]